MFRRILIANRGEIAVRIIRACRELGIESVAVYSDADARAVHTTRADRAVRIGPPPAAQSYLSSDAILAAARETGAEAIHPGYGFLAESHTFADACSAAGITFIGPPAAVIARLGSKIAARQLAAEAGIPVVPGAIPSSQDESQIADTARRVGFPLIVKPSEGGGGIGMKTVREEAALAGAIAQARREATAAFGDGTLYLERLIERPRHVEVQVFADRHGHVVHLFERECSLQRRHQKVVEESPSTALTPQLRSRMGAAAVALATAAGYQNAGTVEFLLEGAGDAARFYFLEMNTRLQVEHPVTEQTTGIDLVRTQIVVAAGEALPWSQDQIAQRGHAIEVRLYAEDPSRGDLPQAGRLLRYQEPSIPGVRVDSGVAEGSEIPVYYDPLLAKLIASGETREAARQRALTALRSFRILGIRTNVAFLIALLEHPRFISGDLDTGLIDAERDRLLAAIPDEPPAAPSSAGAPRDPWTTLQGWRADGTHSSIAHTARDPQAAASVEAGFSASHDEVALSSPMPATVRSVHVTPGQVVARGDLLVMLEAMKMEMPIRAPRDGTVTFIRCKPAELVQAGVPLVEFES
jgi:acetyl-CoA/propionyl-CoA carboxylase biotin carboxyl carrier protein